MVEPGAVTIVHLKMKFHSYVGKIYTIHDDLEPSYRCYPWSLQPAEGPPARITPHPKEFGSPDVNVVDFDSRLEPKLKEDEKKDSIVIELKKDELKRPIPDGYFICPDCK